MKTKELNTSHFLVNIDSQNRLTVSQLFSFVSRTHDRQNGGQSNSKNFGGFILDSNISAIEQKNGWRQNVALANMIKTVIFGIVLSITSLSYSQSNSNIATARMKRDNSISIRTGLNDIYKISMGHFGFSSKEEAEAYFQKRNVDYITFVVVDTDTLLMQFDINNPALASWTIVNWEEALESRAANSSPRTLSRN